MSFETYAHFGFSKLPFNSAVVIELQQKLAPPPKVIGQSHAPHQHIIPDKQKTQISNT